MRAANWESNIFGGSFARYILSRFPAVVVLARHPLRWAFVGCSQLFALTEWDSGRRRQPSDFSGEKLGLLGAFSSSATFVRDVILFDFSVDRCLS